jgi:hypothetical protein
LDVIVDGIEVVFYLAWGDRLQAGLEFKEFTVEEKRCVVEH